MESLREIFFKIDRIHSFDVRCWTFDVRCSSVSFSIRLAVFQASGDALSTEKGGLIILKTSLIWSDEALMRRTIDDNKQQQPLLNL
jgi:hypothetical protein